MRRTQLLAHDSEATPTLEGTLDMALSDQLSQLAAKAKELEDRAAAGKTKAKSDLEQDVKSARSAADAKAEALHKSAQARKGKLSAWWENLQDEWNKQIAFIRGQVDQKKAEHDAKSAQRRAEGADEDADFAVEYAYAAIEEAEYAVLDAALAHKEADELAAASKK